jgi:hypothetical protein
MMEHMIELLTMDYTQSGYASIQAELDHRVNKQGWEVVSMTATAIPNAFTVLYRREKN